MNIKEIREIRQRFRPDRANIRSVIGAFVNGSGAVISRFNQSISTMDEQTSTPILSLLKKTLSGTPGKNLINLSFSTAAVADGEEHKLLTAMNKSGLSDEDAVNRYLEKVIATVKTDGNYLVLIAHDTYDVFAYRKDGSREEDSTEVFSYIVSCVCPVKDAKAALGVKVKNGEGSLTQVGAESVVGSPILGFTFPAFDDRKTNIYGALYYTKDTSDSHEAFVDAVFHTKLPMPADTQRATFSSVLADTLDDSLDLGTLGALRAGVGEMIENHKESGDPEPLTLSKTAVTDLLAGAGVDAEHVEAFAVGFDEAFGKNAELPPANVIEPKKLEVRTPDVRLRIDPEHADLLSTRIIGGQKYLLIRAEGEVLVNGLPISFERADKESED